MNKTVIEIPEGFKRIEKVENGITTISFIPTEESIVPNNWVDFCKKVPLEESEAYITGNGDIRCLNLIQYRGGAKHLFISSRRAKAMLSFIQLIRARDYVNGDWVADWRDDNSKYVILSFCSSIKTESAIKYCHPLHFKTSKIRDQFLTNFRDLIEEAKEFI